MISAADWYEKFSEEFKFQKIDEWRNALIRSSETAWTYRIVEFLRNLATKMGYQMEYEIGTDFSWCEKNSRVPTVAIEHENKLNSEQIIRDEIQKLFHSAAPLKILITYIRKKEELKERDKIIEFIKHPKEIGGEFLLVFINRLDKRRSEFEHYIF